MALSRLRNPVISRAPSLLRARSLSFSRSSTSSRFLSRSSSSRISSFSGDEVMLRPASFFMTTGVHNIIERPKFQIGVRCFSSEDSPPHTVLQMPALSPTMTQGNIARWRKKEGEKVEVGDILCEIETDKATLEFECLDEGFLAKILVPEGSKDVPVGQPIAVMVEESEDIAKVPASIVGGSGAQVEEASSKDVKRDGGIQEKSKPSISASQLPPHIVVAMPALSPTMNQGNIFKWRKKEGDKIEVGDVICEIETDKATLEFESLEEGYLAKILAPEGSKDVSVGQPIAITVEDPTDIEAVKSSAVSGSVQEEKAIHQEQRTEVKVGKSVISRISPSAKVLISEHGLDVSSLKASGAHGTLLKADVLAAIKSGTASQKLSKEGTSSPDLSTQPRSAASMQGSPAKRLELYEDLPNSQIRKVIAKRLLESKQNTPHLYLSTDVILDPLLSFRKELKEQHDVKVSVNDIVIKAVAVALRNVPNANAYWDAEKGEVVLCDSVDVSIAVATDKGLMTPIIRNADQKTISSISQEVKELAEKARAGKLKPTEFQGGTFSISNLGMFPVDQFCAIINPPQAGILAVGRGNKIVEPVTRDDGVERPVVVTKMSLTLSADHRVFDGKVGGEFLSTLRLNFGDMRRLML